MDNGIKLRINEINNGRYTMEQLANKIGMTRGHLQRIKSGDKRWNVDILIDLSNALGCEPIDLISDINSNNKISNYIDLIEQSVTVIEEVLKDNSLELNTPEKAKLIGAVFELFVGEVESGRPPVIDKSQLKTMLRLVG